MLNRHLSNHFNETSRMNAIYTIQKLECSNEPLEEIEKCKMRTFESSWWTIRDKLRVLRWHLSKGVDKLSRQSKGCTFKIFQVTQWAIKPSKNERRHFFKEPDELSGWFERYNIFESFKCPNEPSRPFKRYKPRIFWEGPMNYWNAFQKEIKRDNQNQSKVLESHNHEHAFKMMIKEKKHFFE